MTGHLRSVSAASEWSVTPHAGIWSQPPRDVAALRARGRSRCYPSGMAMFLQGDVPEASYVVERGIARAITMTEDGRGLALAVMGRDDVFGADVAFPLAPPRTPSSPWVAVATVEAVTDCTVLVVPRGALIGWADGGATRTRALMAAQGARLVQATERLRRTAIPDSRSRLAAELLALVPSYGRRGRDGIALQLPLSQGDLAALAGCSRETANRAVVALIRMGGVQRRGRRYTLLDPGLLSEVAGGRVPLSAQS